MAIQSTPFPGAQTLPPAAATHSFQLSEALPRPLVLDVLQYLPYHEQQDFIRCEAISRAEERWATLTKHTETRRLERGAWSHLSFFFHGEIALKERLIQFHLTEIDLRLTDEELEEARRRRQFYPFYTDSSWYRRVSMATDILPRLPHLTSLSFDFLDEPLVAAVGRCKQLQHLHFEKPIKDWTTSQAQGSLVPTFLTLLPEWPRLKTLHLHHPSLCSRIEKEFTALFNGLASLEIQNLHLRKIGKNPESEAAFIQFMVTRGPQLQELMIKEPDVSRPRLLAVLNNLSSSLRVLSLYQIPRPIGWKPLDWLPLIGQRCPALTTLQLPSCGLIDEDFFPIAARCTALEVLDLRNNHVMGPLTSTALLTHCRSLREVRACYAFMSSEHKQQFKARGITLL